MVKNPPANAGNKRDAGSILRSEGPLGKGNGNPLQAKGAWRAAVCGNAKSWIRVSAHAPRSLRDMPEKDKAVHIWLTT